MLVKYNPKKINGGWNNIPWLGYMDGTFVELEFAEDAVTVHIGSQGDVSLILNANRMVTVTVTFIQGSPTNAALTPFIPSAALNQLTTAPLSLKDLNGTTLVSGKDAFIRKAPKIEFAKSLTGRQWVFVIPSCDTFNVGIGGS